MNQSIDIQLYNGCITVSNPTSGGHRVYSIYTSKVGPKKEKIRYIGKRTGGVMKAFAKIHTDGRVYIFPDYRGAEARVDVSILLYPDAQMKSHGLEYQAECTCRECGRKLTDPDSIKRGVGPVCLGYLGLTTFAKSLKPMSDGQRFGELRSAAYGGRYKEALLALGYIDDHVMRLEARHYLNEVYQGKRPHTRYSLSA